MYTDVLACHDFDHVHVLAGLSLRLLNCDYVHVQVIDSFSITIMTEI